jgi:hypothetical protein
MSNLVPFKGQKIAKAFQGIDRGPALGANLQSGFSSIRMRGKRWSLQHAGHSYPFVRPDDGSPLTYLDLIIVGEQPKTSKAYFPGDFDEDNASGPTCASVRGDVPDPGVPIPQSKTCASCKHNQWTTLPTGRRGMECQSHRRLAVLLLPALTKKMLGSPLLEPVFLKVPPGSFQAFKAYGAELDDEGYPPFAVVTRVGFHPDKLFEVTFEGVKVLTDKEAEHVKPMLDSPTTRRIIGETTLIPETKAVERREPVETGLIEAFTGDENKPAAKQEDEWAADPEPEEKKPAPRKPKAAPAKEITAKVAEAVQESTTETFDYEAADAETDKAISEVVKKSVGEMFN